MSELDEILESGRSHKGCRMCGQSESAAAIGVQIRELNKTRGDKKNNPYGPRSNQKQVSLCPGCAAKLWVQLNGLMP